MDQIEQLRLTYQSMLDDQRTEIERTRKVLADVRNLLRPEQCPACGEGESVLVLVEYEGRELLMRTCEHCHSEYAGKEMSVQKEMDAILGLTHNVLGNRLAAGGAAKEGETE